MADRNETVADIVSELRDLSTHLPEDSAIRVYADRIEAAAELERIDLREDEAMMLLKEYAAAPDETLTQSALEVKRKLLSLAPKPEAVGNAAKLREVLEWATSTIDVSPEVLDETEDWENEVVCWVLELQDKARAALAAPARNCDVLTAEEQSRRFCAFCRPRTEPCDGCACLEGSRKGRCEFAWAQMPYESPAAQEGGDNGKD